jgi:hypothetical protein
MGIGNATQTLKQAVADETDRHHQTATSTNAITLKRGACK